MLNNFDINHLLTFSVKDAEARKHFLIGVLINLLAFIIPVLPMFVIIGYLARIARQVLRDEKAHMEPWEDFGEMFIAGAKLFAIRIVFMLPFLILFIPFMAGLFAFPFLLESGNETIEQMAFLFPLFLMAISVLFLPISFAVGLFTPVAEIHSVAEDEFTAGFHIRAWWAIFRENWGGFLLAFAISYAVSFVLTILTQFAMMTIVLVCILPIIMSAISMYMTLVMYTAFTQAYKTGVDQLANKPAAEIA